MKTIFDEVNDVLKSDESAYSISKRTGVPQSMISRYRNGESNVLNMTLDIASKLTCLNYSDDENDSVRRVYCSLLAMPILKFLGYNAYSLNDSRFLIDSGKLKPFCDYFNCDIDDMNNMYIFMKFENSDDINDYYIFD